LVLMPPLSITDDEIDTLVEAIRTGIIAELGDST
jgi:adenosylmethionine-8-amino-7-oxononanoate aminotransferase